MSSATDVDPSPLVYRTPTEQLTYARYRRSKRSPADRERASNASPPRCVVARHAPSAPNSVGLWKLLPQAQVVGQLVAPHEEVLKDRLQQIRVAMRPHPMTTAFAPGALTASTGLAFRRELSGAVFATDTTSSVSQPAIVTPQFRASLSTQLKGLDIRDRLLVSDVIWTGTPTAPAATDKVVVKFDYCVVQVRRPWLFDVFLNAGNWAIPGVAQGALSDGTTPGSISQLPIAMVVVRNLMITANWSADDMAASSNATAFGPFKVDGGIVDGSLTHKSVQTIGWLLQQLPELPPQNYVPDPAPAGAPR